MSGASINKKIQKAFQKVGNILGSNFQVFRSVNYLDPIQPQNYLKDVKLAFATDTSFDAPVDSSYKQMNLFTDATDLKVGDILISEEQGKTFTLVNKDDLQRPQGIVSTHTITISRSAYSTTGGFKAQSESIAANIPAAIHQAASKSDKGILSEAASHHASIATYHMWIWLPENNIKVGDLVVDSFGNKTKIDSIEFTPVGYKLSCTATKANT